MLESTATTRSVRVHVVPQYLPEQSEPASGLWVHAYTVTITNLGDAPVQLVNRHWVITNGKGQVEHVRGPGVVGNQPVLQPGQSYQYTSGCPLDTNFGTMHGSYEMSTPDGERFEVEVAPFTLAEPYAMN